MFGARVLIQEEIVTALVLDGAIDQATNLLGGKRGFGALALVLVRVLWRYGSRPGSGEGHPSGHDGHQTETELSALSHPHSRRGASRHFGRVKAREGPLHYLIKGLGRELVCSSLRQVTKHGLGRFPDSRYVLL